MAKLFSVVCVAALCALAKAGIYGGLYENHGHGLGHAEPQYQRLGSFVGKHQLPPKEIRITKTLAVKVPVPYPVKVPHSVPYPVHVVKHVPVPVTKIVKVHEQVPVPIPKPYPVPVYKQEASAPVYKHDAPVQHQVEQVASYSAPVRQERHQLEQQHEQITDNSHQHAQIEYFKESGKSISPVFDISAFHPTVMFKGNQQKYQGFQLPSYHGHVQSHGESHAAPEAPVTFDHEQHQQQEDHSGLEHQQQQHSIEGQSFSHQEQHQIPDYHYQFEQQSEGGSHGAAPQVSYHEQHQQIQQEPHSAGGQSSEHDYSQYSAASAGQEHAFSQKQLEEYSGHSQGEHQHVEQHYQPQIEQHGHYETPAPQYPVKSSHLPAAHTYSYFRLGGHGQGASHGLGSSHGLGESHSLGSSLSHGYGRHLEQPTIQYKHEEAQPHEQEAPQQHFQHEAVKSQGIGSFSHNIGQAVLKEVQGPHFSGHGGGDLKSHPIYLPSPHQGQHY